MNLLLCMAGLYQRFRDAGYTTPKFLLPWKGTTVLDHVLNIARESGARPYLVANRRDEAHAEVLRAILERAGGTGTDLVFVGDTAGQAETARLGIEVFGLAETNVPLLIHNIDTLLLGRDWGRIRTYLARADGWIDVFDADSPQYSYVETDAEGKVLRIREKEVISRLATTGLYGFASTRAYLDALARSNPSREELYVSDVYVRMLADGATILAPPPGPAERTIVLGTPDEYEAARAAS